MFERLKELKNQYEELLRRMEEPETYSDPKLYARCEREARELQPLAEAYTAWEHTAKDIAAADGAGYADDHGAQAKRRQKRLLHALLKTAAEKDPQQAAAENRGHIDKYCEHGSITLN